MILFRTKLNGIRFDCLRKKMNDQQIMSFIRYLVVRGIKNKTKLILIKMHLICSVLLGLVQFRC